MFTFFNKFCTFALECDWNNKISQNKGICFFLQKSMGFFRKTFNFFKTAKFGIFLQIVHQMVIFPKKSVSILFVRFFLAKNQKNFKGVKVRNFDEETEYLIKMFSFKKASVTKSKDAKPAGSSWPSWLWLFQTSSWHSFKQEGDSRRAFFKKKS